MLSRKAKHLVLAANISTSSWSRFFAALHYAQNDKLCYFLAKAKLIAIFDSTLAGRRGDRIGKFDLINSDKRPKKRKENASSRSS